jgi:hypothetical protein
LYDAILSFSPNNAALSRRGQRRHFLIGAILIWCAVLVIQGSTRGPTYEHWQFEGKMGLLTAMEGGR